MMRNAKLLWFLIVVLALGIAGCTEREEAPPAPAEPPPTANEPATTGPKTVSGTVKGRSGKPLAKAWVCLGQLEQSVIEGKDVKLALTQLTAVTDDDGRFQIEEVPASTYTLVYQPSPATGARGGREISVANLAAGQRSTMPDLREREVGTFKPFKQRPWSRQYTLMKGHTLFNTASGKRWKIWNASVRRGRRGPFLEIRKNKIWRQDFQKDSNVTFEAWSF
jgi:hypothetical protein